MFSETLQHVVEALYKIYIFATSLCNQDSCTSTVQVIVGLDREGMYVFQGII